MNAQGLRRLIAVLSLFSSPSLATPSGPGDIPPRAPAETRADAPPAKSAPRIAETTAMESLGKGASRDEAIAEALSLAVARVRGKDLPLDALRSMFLDAMRDERKVRMNVLNDYRVQATRLSTAVAFVQDYQVQEARRDRKDGHWEARVTADVVDPARRLAAREQVIRLTMLPFRFMQEEESEAGGPQSQQLMEHTLRQIAGFRTRVEQMMGREARLKVSPVHTELAESLATALETPGAAGWDKLGPSSGATHLVTVQAEEFRMDAVEMRRGVRSGRLDGKFVFHYRIISNDESSATILKSGTFTMDTHHPGLRPLAMAPTGAPQSDSEIDRRVQTSLDIVARKFAELLMDTLVPPDVIAREGDAVLLRSGAIPLRQHEQLVVLGAPTQAADAASGLLQRQDGARIAILEVTATGEDRIEARILKGNAMGVQPGSFVRRMGLEPVAKTGEATRPLAQQTPACEGCDPGGAPPAERPERKIDTDASHNAEREELPKT